MMIVGLIAITLIEIMLVTLVEMVNMKIVIISIMSLERMVIKTGRMNLLTVETEQAELSLTMCVEIVVAKVTGQGIRFVRNLRQCTRC